MIDLRLLAALDAIVQHGGFDKAGQALHLTQSAVSQRLKQLEDQLGQLLVIREQPPRATAAAEALLQHLRQVRALEADLTERLRLTGQHDSSGPLRLSVGINADSLAIFGETLYQRWQQPAPLLVEFVVDLEESTLELLKRGEVTGCISTHSQALPGCSASPLGTMHYRLVASPQFALRYFPQGLTLAALARAPALLYNRRDRMLPGFLQQHCAALPPLPTLCVPSSHDYARFALAGHGYAIVPEAQCLPALQSGDLLELLPGKTLAVPLYWHAWSLRTALLQRLQSGVEAVAATALARPAAAV